MVFLLAHERVNPRESSIRHRGSSKRDQHQAGFCYDKMFKKDTPPTSNKLIALYDTLCGVGVAASEPKRLSSLVPRLQPHCIYPGLYCLCLSGHKFKRRRKGACRSLSTFELSSDIPAAHD